MTFIAKLKKSKFKGVLLLIGLFLLSTLVNGITKLFKDKPEEYLKNKTSTQLRATKIAMAISSALGILKFRFNDDEQAVIDMINTNNDILPEIAKAFKDLTKKGLLTTLTKELDPEDIKELNLTSIE